VFSLMVVPHEIPPPKKKNNLGLKTSIFGAKIETPPSSDGRCAETTVGGLVMVTRGPRSTYSYAASDPVSTRWVTVCGRVNHVDM